MGIIELSISDCGPHFIYCLAFEPPKDSENLRHLRTDRSHYWVFNYCRRIIHHMACHCLRNRWRLSIGIPALFLPVSVHFALTE